MKITRLLCSFVLSCLFVVAARAADFEGTLKWSISAEITDPQMKAQMAESQKQMADPAQLAQMKAMLEDPQMKAMMEQNPQMKAAMEAQIKAAEDAAAGKGGGDTFTAMMPKAMTVLAKGGKSHLVSEGGAMPMEIITLSEPPTSYLIDRKARTFSKMPLDEGKAKAEAAKRDYTVKKGPGSTKILGYTCEQYLVEARHDGETVRGTFWATDDIPGLDAKALAKARFGGEDAVYFAEINGVPLKVEMDMPQMRMVMQATAVTPGAVPDSAFEVPAGFVEKPFVLGAPGVGRK
jgi:hypothetical protein